MNRYWFKPKTRGFGANPSTWEGWVSFIVVLALIVAAPTLVSRLFADAQEGRILALLAVFAILAAFIGLCAWKTEGGLRWRGGSRD
jgi:uncharacterized membrane protein YhaH (DUF805 family)